MRKRAVALLLLPIIVVSTVIVVTATEEISCQTPSTPLGLRWFLWNGNNVTLNQGQTVIFTGHRTYFENGCTITSYEVR